MEPTTFEIEAEAYRRRWQAALSEIERLKGEIEAQRRESIEWERAFYRTQDAMCYGSSWPPPCG